MTTDLVPTNLRELGEWATACSKSSLLPPELVGKEANVFVPIAAGRELGLSPMAALRSIHVVKGKPVLSADAMVAVVLASGKALYFRRVDGDDSHATYETHRKGDPAAVKMTYTRAEAQRAGLTKDNWERHPAAMLRARAKSILARDVYPDILAGVYAPEEIDDHPGFVPVMTHPPMTVQLGADWGPKKSYKPQPEEEVQDAELVEEPPAAEDPKSLARAILAAGSPIELTALLPRLQRVPKDHPSYEELRSLYGDVRAKVWPATEGPGR